MHNEVVGIVIIYLLLVVLVVLIIKLFFCPIGGLENWD